MWRTHHRGTGQARDDADPSATLTFPEFVRAQRAAKTGKVEGLRDHFTEVKSCGGTSKAYAHIKTGTPLKTVEETKHVPGVGAGASGRRTQSTKAVIHPPRELGTVYVVRDDYQSKKTFYFFHDGNSLTGILWLPLLVGPVPEPIDSKRTWRDWTIGPLIIEKRK